MRPGVDDGDLAAAYGVDVSATEGLTRRPALADGWPGQALSVLGLIAFEIIGTIGAAQQQPEREPVDALAIALVVGSALPLLARRRFPLSALFATHSVVLAYLLLDYPRGPIFLSPLIAFFSAVLLGRRVGAWIVLAIGFVASVMLPTVLGDEPAPTIGEVLGFGAWLLVVAGAAEIVRVRRERVAAAARMQEEEERRRASEERLAIARELHDVLAHNISMINVQAGVALHLIDERPEQARTALAAIKEASKEALSEVRSVLGVLRRVDGGRAEAPAPPGPPRRPRGRGRAAGPPVTERVQGRARCPPRSNSRRSGSSRRR